MCGGGEPLSVVAGRQAGTSGQLQLPTHLSAFIASALSCRSVIRCRLWRSHHLCGQECAKHQLPLDGPKRETIKAAAVGGSGGGRAVAQQLQQRRQPPQRSTLLGVWPQLSSSHHTSHPIVAIRSREVAEPGVALGMSRASWSRANSCSLSLPAIVLQMRSGACLQSGI